MSGENGGTGTVWAAADIFGGSCAEGGGAWDDEGYNVGSDASCFSATPASTDNDSAGAGLASLLGPLANNGGPTETVLPLPGNPALSIVPSGTSVDLDGTTTTLCPTTDQRGVASEPGQACAAGSVQESLPVALAQSFSTTEGTELTEPAGTLPSGVVDYNPGVSLLDGRADRTPRWHRHRWHRRGLPRRLVHLHPRGRLRGHGQFQLYAHGQPRLRLGPGHGQAHGERPTCADHHHPPDYDHDPHGDHHHPHQHGGPARRGRPDDHDCDYHRFVAAPTVPALRPELPQRRHRQLLRPRLRLRRWAGLLSVGHRPGRAREGRPRQGNLCPGRHERPDFKGAALWHVAHAPGP